jgi:hypothetical protein
MIFEKWDSRSNNIVDAFDTEREALLALQRAILTQGEGVADHLELLWDDEEQDEHGIVGIGSELIELAMNAE